MFIAIFWSSADKTSVILILAISVVALAGCAKTQQLNVPDNIKSNAMNFVEFPNVKAPDFKLIK